MLFKSRLHFHCLVVLVGWLGWLLACLSLFGFFGLCARRATMAKLHQQKCIMHAVVYITNTCICIICMQNGGNDTIIEVRKGREREWESESGREHRCARTVNAAATEPENPKECQFTMMFYTIWDREKQRHHPLKQWIGPNLRCHCADDIYMHCAFIRLMHSLTQTSVHTPSIRSASLSLSHICNLIQHLCTWWNDAISFSSTIRVFWHMDAVCVCSALYAPHCTRNT